MPLVPINDIGRLGIIKDTPPYNLPKNAWSDGNNVRFLDNGVQKCAGYLEVMATVPFVPYYITNYLTIDGTYYWLAFGSADIAVWNGSTWTDVTRQTTQTLNGAINDAVTTITLTDASDFPTSGNISLGTREVVDGGQDGYEEMTYSGKSSNDLTGVGRAANSTTAAPHTDGAVVVPIGTTLTTDNDYNANVTDRRWVTTSLNGLFVATNGYDSPQMWPLSGGIPSLTTPFKELDNWPSALVKQSGNSNFEAKSIRAYKSFLMALNMSKADPEPRMIKWSTIATAYNAPISWSTTDTDLDGGEYTLAETPGEIIDGLQWGDSFLVYKESSIFIVNYVGSQETMFTFKLLSPTIGLLAKDALAEFEGGHFFMGNSDFYLCNGQSVTALLPNKLRRAVYDNFNGDYYKKCFVVADYARTEMLACYPSAGSTNVDKAVIWNWRESTFSIRDLPDVSSIGYGIVEITAGATWDTGTTTWDATSDPWGSTNYQKVLKNIVFADYANTKLYRDNKGNKQNTADMTSYIERTGYDLDDPSLVKFVSAVYPEIEVSGNNTVNIYIGTQMSTEAGVDWNPDTGGAPYLFNPNTQSKLSCRATGKFFGIRVESTTDMDWKLHSVGFEVKARGRRGSRMQ